MPANIANSIPSARFTAVLMEGDEGLSLESALREQGCSVRRVSVRDAAQEALETADVVVISSAGSADDEVLELVGRATVAAGILLATDDTDLAVKAARLGASTVRGGSLELAAAQIGQLLALVDLKRRVAGQSSSTSAPTALIEAAEGLVPMDRFQRAYVDYALVRFGGNKVHTAAALGIDRRTIQRWARARADQSPIASGNRVSAA